MTIDPNIHDTKFKPSIVGLNKTEVYHYLYEVEVAYQEALERIDRLSDNNEQLTKHNHDNMLKIYNLQSALTEATTIPMVAEEDSIEEDTTVVTQEEQDKEDTTVLAQETEDTEQEIENVFLGEVEDNSGKAFRIGDGDDEDAGLTFV